MSSLAASRADNFYYPPEWRPEYGGISKYQGSKGANQYQQSGVIRFELPFDGWCLKCKRHLAKGTRFNAKKEKNGKYFTTILYQFNMKCPSCDQILIIKTNPKERTYDYSEGIRKMEQDYQPDQEDHTLNAKEIKDEDEIFANMNEQERAEHISNPIYRLQNENIQIKKVQSVNERLDNLLKHNMNTKHCDYEQNSRLRKKLRCTKQIEKEQLDISKKKQVSYPVLPYDEKDTIMPSTIPTRKRDYMEITTKLAKQKEILKFTQLKSESIFSKNNSCNLSKYHKDSNMEMISKAMCNTNTVKRQRIYDAKVKQATFQIDTKAFIRK